MGSQVLQLKMRCRGCVRINWMKVRFEVEAWRAASG